MITGKAGRLAFAGAALAVLATVAVPLASVTPPSAAATRIVAVGAENEYADVIAQIGGAHVSVDSIMSNPNTDPHLFEASPSVAREIASASLVVQNGVGYDTFMSRLESASPSAHRTVIVVQSLLRLPTNTPNPHLWYKPTTMGLVASAVERALARLDRADAPYFAARLARFQASMSTLRASYAAFDQRFGGRPVATTEPVADYLLTALGLTNRTPFAFQSDIMNGVDPSPQDVSLEDSLLSGHRVAMLCYNAQVVSPVTLETRALAVRSRVPIVAVYETMPTGYDYQTWMAAELRAMSAALAHHTSTTTLLK
ncbi:MAG TPA: zinc ABC transporter substrate-binding protein [Acidimicrobiales bacterium]|nr:zinc ABC transporter substrate-binding protein [Acidimicrobiales bacterium]